MTGEGNGGDKAEKAGLGLKFLVMVGSWDEVNGPDLGPEIQQTSWVAAEAALT